ncbi:hypothetical protein [Devosia sp. CAU 1758]
MRILNLRRFSDAGSLVAIFDLEATPEITLNDWQLRRTPKGFRAFPPSPRHGRSTAQVAPLTFTEIGRLAAAAFEMEGSAHERIRAA